MSLRTGAVLLIALAALSGCPGGGSTGARTGGGALGIGDVVSAQGDGAKVDFDPDALPVPEIPLPNDVLTRPDPTSPTGKRVNVPLDSDTTFEFDIRQAINELDGFGLAQPFSVSFDGPIDLDTVRVNFDDDPDNDTIFVVNIGPGSPRFGERVEIDWTRSLLPVRRVPQRPFRLNAVIPFDEADALSLLKTGGPLTNVAMGIGNAEDFYEEETHTLLMQPALPLEEKSVYAVYLTRGLKDARGKTIRSPFNPAVAIFTQYADLNRGLPVLADLGVPVGQIAFAWSFTTMDAFRALDLARMGLDGEGPLAYLREDFAPRIEALDPAMPDGSLAFYARNFYAFALAEGPALLSFVGSDIVPIGLAEGLRAFLDDPAGYAREHADLGAALGALLGTKEDPPPPSPLGLSGRLVDGILPSITFEHVSHIVAGVYRSPRFTDARKVFNQDVVEGRRRLDPSDPDHYEEVPFLVTVPKTVPPGTRKTGYDQPPFPVIQYIHPNQTERIIALIMANRAAEYGFAVAAIDQAEHGPILPFPERQLGALLERADPQLATLALDLIPFAIGVLNVAGFSDFPVDEPPPASISLLGLLAEASERAELVSALPEEEILQRYADIPLVKMFSGRGRATEDRDHDGLIENGEAFFTSDLGRTRDLIRQTIIDQMQMTRLMNALCVDRDGDGALSALEGDFDGDGVCDAGGAANTERTVAMGVSQGGLLGAVYAGVESDRLVKNAALSVPGGAYVKIVERTNLGFVYERVLRETLGPFAAAIPYDGSAAAAELGVGPGEVAVTLVDREIPSPDTLEGLALLNRGTTPEDRFAPYVVMEASEPTDLSTLLDAPRDGAVGRSIHVRNLRRDIDAFGAVGPGGAFAVGIPADAGDRIRIATPKGEAILVAAAAGLGLPRNTARLRRFLDIAQLVIDPSDAFNFAPRWALRPPPGLGPKNVLIQTSVGDPTVPAANQIALMRASGALRGAPLDKVVSAGLVVGARKIPTEEELPGRDARLEDMCICIDGSKRKAQCSGKDEFNEMLGMGAPWRDETWARLSGAAGEPNYTIATFHPSGEHGYFFAPGSVEANGMSLGAERYTLLAQFQALDYVIDPSSFTPLARTYRSEDEQCAVDLFGAGAAQALPTFANFLDLACGSCDLNLTCDAAGPLGPAAGVALNALRLSVWWGPLALLGALRRRAARRARNARYS